MKPQRAPMTELAHGRFLSLLAGWKADRYSDGGPSDRNRSRKRATAKRQRQARKANR